MSDKADQRCTGVENGRKISFDLAADGRAAVTVVNGITSLAYAARDRRAKLPDIGSTVAIEGEDFTVVSVKEFKAPRLFRLVLAPIEAGI